MRFGLAANPTQNEVNRRYQLHLHRVRIQGILARRQRRTPDTAFARFDLFAIAKGLPGSIGAGATIVGNYYADISDRNQRLGFDLNRPKPAINKEGSVRQDLKLFASASTEREESFRILKVIMILCAIRRFDFRG